MDLTVRLDKAPHVYARANTSGPLLPYNSADALHRQYGLTVDNDVLIWLPTDDTERARTIDRLQAALEGLRAPSPEGHGTYPRYDSKTSEEATA
jgi:hypothetical protein